MPKVKVELHSWLADSFTRDGRYTLELKIEPGTTVKELLTDLAQKYKVFNDYVLDQEQKLKGYTYLVLNEKLLELAGGLEAELQEGDTLTIVPAYAGG